MQLKQLFVHFFLLIHVIGKISSQSLEFTIVDEKKEPVVGAVVHTLTSDKYYSSDQKGIVYLTNALNEQCIVSFFGFKVDTFQVNQSLIEHPLIMLHSESFSLEQVTIAYSVKATNLVSDIDLKINPVSSSQEVLRTVPGLFIGQHAGGGKAEQMFLRGFDVDHGTDVAVSVEGMPVNMVSHAHGQGYADLHFVIPETIKKIDFGKGPYYADKGDFTTGAYVNFQLKEKLDHSAVTLEAGQYNSYRSSALINVFNHTHSSMYFAGEYNHSDGWFVSPQNFYRANFMTRFNTELNTNNSLSIIASQFSSKWNASGQVPTRAVEDGSISRFGSIDNTEGGNTSRQHLIASLQSKLSQNLTFEQKAFISKYNFNLFSDFTFFLNDPIHGDQINQREHRTLFGYNANLLGRQDLKSATLKWDAGLGFRTDEVNQIALANAEKRMQLSLKKYGNINELNSFGYLNANFESGRWLINPSLRLDHFNFIYTDLLDDGNKKSASKALLSPKLNIVYQANPHLQYYFKSGLGFHSNDARVVLQQTSKDILPIAKGLDLGMIWKPSSRWIVNSALWILHLNQEFVYIGDDGIVEPSGRTRRLGIDFGLRYQPNDWLFFNSDINYSHGRSIDDPKGQNYIPLAPILSSMGALTIHKNKFELSFNYRFLSKRPANEDYSLTAQGYFVNDFAGSYTLNNKIRLHVRVENIFNVKWNETQFATLTRLKTEVNPVDEIHFTPGTPFFLKGGVTVSF